MPWSGLRTATTSWPHGREVNWVINIWEHAPWPAAPLIRLLETHGLGGHAGLNTTRRYTLPSEVDKTRALDALITDR